jgi:hypothetical protein
MHALNHTCDATLKQRDPRAHPEMIIRQPNGIRKLFKANFVWVVRQPTANPDI